MFVRLDKSKRKEQYNKVSVNAMHKTTCDRENRIQSAVERRLYLSGPIVSKPTKRQVEIQECIAAKKEVENRPKSTVKYAKQPFRRMW